jgi:ribose 5-phosphate isomerase B
VGRRLGGHGFQAAAGPGKSIQPGNLNIAWLQPGAKRLLYKRPYQSGYLLREEKMSELKIIIGCDHGAYQLKEILVAQLVKEGIPVKDVGVSGPESVDYPVIGMQVASQVSQGKYPRGILLCGTGLGMSMVANRYPHVRAALCNDLFSAVLSRQHNDANILVMGGRVIGDVLALEILKSWLETPYEGDRHQRRLDLFDTIKC